VPLSTCSKDGTGPGMWISTRVGTVIEAVESEQAQIGVGPCPRCSGERERTTVNTVEFDILNLDGLGTSVQRFRSCGGAHRVHFLAAHPTVLARADPGYRQLLNTSDLTVADGAPVAAMLRLARPAARRITSTDAFLRLCEDGARTGARHYFLGGADETIARRVETAVRSTFPGLTVAGFEVPPFRPYTDEELRAVAGRIRAARADVVWVGIGAPKQDVLADRLTRAGAAPAILCIGATFDFVAGTKRRAPRWMRAVGLEWLFRLLLEPRRLWRRYLIGNLQFVTGACVDMIAAHRTRRR